MVMGHVGFGGQFDKWIHGFHMPLWFVIAGFFLNTRRKTTSYLKRKIKSILVPYLFFGICYEVIWTISGHNQWFGLIWPNSIQIPLNGALWFLPALFFVDVVGMFFYKYLGDVVASIIIFLIALIGSFHLFSLPLSIDSALVGCGFFLIGRLIRKYNRLFFKLNLLSAICLAIAASVLIMLNGYVNVRANEYAIVPLFWIDAILATIALWNICQRIDEKTPTFDCVNQGMSVLKEIGSESLIYVCTNQYILFLLNKVHLFEGNTVVMHIWHLTEVSVIIAVCFLANRIIKKTDLKFVLGK